MDILVLNFVQKFGFLWANVRKGRGGSFPNQQISFKINAYLKKTKNEKFLNKALEDPKFLSNVISAILDLTGNTTSVHTNQMSRVYIHQYQF